MADNTLQTGSDTIATDDVTTLNGGASSGVKVQRVKNMYGADGTATDVSDATPFPVTGGILGTTSQAISAAGTGTLGPLDVTRAANATFVVKNTTAGSAWAGAPVLVFEQSDDGTSWGPLLVVRGDTGQPGSTFTLGPGIANGELMFDAQLEGVEQVRVRCTTGPTTNGLTLTVTAGGMPFVAGGSVLAIPTDGHKKTYVHVGAASGTILTWAPHLSTGVPWLEVWNPANSGVRARITRIRLEFTLATAALLTFQLVRQTALATGGTAQGFSGVTALPIDATDPTTAITTTGWTVAPTGGGPNNAIAGRRLWVGLATAAGAPYVEELEFGSGRPGKAITLQPGAGLGFWWGTAPGTAVTLSHEVEWTEEPA